MDVKIDKRGGQFREIVWFWSVTLVFAGLWLALPSLLHSAYKGDTIELQLIGKEWVWATTKHPMMSAWILEICNILTHRAFAAPFIASTFCTIVMLFSIWQVARNVLPEKYALISTFVMLPYVPLTLKSHLFNPNTALMLFWCLTIFTFYYAFQTNKKRWWIAAGLALGLGLHAKYTIALLAVAILFYSLWIPRCRQHWKEIGPWLTVAISSVIFLPHLIWLFQMDSLTTVSYTQEALEKRPIIGNRWDHLLCPIVFTLGNLGFLIISPLLLLVPSLGWRWKRRIPTNETEKETLRYLLCCIGIPFLMLLAVTGMKEVARTTYGFPLWFFLGVYLLLLFQRH
jgi:4-amino-4-deoxy-L-arabinose transferase-like glycosyltransferase